MVRERERRRNGRLHACLDVLGIRRADAHSHQRFAELPGGQLAPQRGEPHPQVPQRQRELVGLGVALGGLELDVLELELLQRVLLPLRVSQPGLIFEHHREALRLEHLDPFDSLDPLSL